MRKNYVLLKQYGLALTLLLTTTIIIYSCKKDLGSSQLSNAELSDLRNWYESNSGKVINDRFQKMKPIWDDVFVSDHDDQMVYELNLENPDQVFQVINATVVKEKSNMNRNLIKLLIFKNKKTSKIDYGVYQSILNEGSILNLEQLHYKQMNGLSGKVMYFNFDGSFSNGWNYASGEVTNSIHPIEQSIYLNAQLDRLSRNQQKGTLEKEKLQLAYPDECMGKITEYGVACAGVEGYMVCNVYEKGSSYFNACGGGNGSGGSGGGYQPPGGSGGTPYFDCAGVRNGQAIDSPCGCIGGTTGLESCVQKEIKDSVQNDCIKAQLLIAKNAKTTIRNMLNDEFGANNFNDRDIVFYDITTLPDAISGTTHGNSAFSFIINLNKNTLPQRSKEYILSTIYHEILHAYMDTQIGKDTSGNYLISNQHQTMADKYVLLMTGALKIAFPDIDDRDAWALSWGGLEETPFYTTKLSAIERAEIQNLNDRHRKNTDANLRHGTYCN